MFNALGKLLWLPFQLMFLLVEILGRTLVIFIGLGLFGIGAFLCVIGIPLLGIPIIIGAPMCLFSGLLVAKVL
jgi:hypothetical protein